jgi:ribosomal protein S18 acetylase RimI-like enzyme
MHTTLLTAAHAAPYRELMLEAYVQAADAFTSTAEERAREPLSWWVNRIAAPSGLGQAFGVFQDQALVGTVALEYSAKPKTQHAALLIGMYVRPEARRLGAAALLMKAALAAAAERPGVEIVRLTVTEGNEPALRLYRSVGFRAWGTEPDAIRTPTGDKGKVHMSLRLGGPSGPSGP